MCRWAPRWLAVHRYNGNDGNQVKMSPPRLDRGATANNHGLRGCYVIVCMHSVGPFLWRRVWVRSFGFIFSPFYFYFCKLCANGLDYSHAINKRKQATMTLYTHSDHRDGKEIRFSSYRMKHFSSFQGHANQTSSIAKWLAIIDTEDRRQKEFALRKETPRCFFSGLPLGFLSRGPWGVALTRFSP